MVAGPKILNQERLGLSLSFRWPAMMLSRLAAQRSLPFLILDIS